MEFRGAALLLRPPRLSVYAQARLGPHRLFDAERLRWLRLRFTAAAFCTSV